MRIFACACGQPVFFENTMCLSCGAATGFDPRARLMVSLEPDEWGALLRRKGAESNESPFKACANFHACGCNWLLPADSPNSLCDACATTRTIPSLTHALSQSRWQRVEAAKRRLLFTLLDLGLWGPQARAKPALPLQFDMLEPDPGQRVTIGHQSGVITIDITEADDDAREHTRVSLYEPYRPLAGHFRHEVGHITGNC